MSDENLPLVVDAIIPRIAFEHVTDADIRSAVERLRYPISVQWETSSDDLSRDTPVNSVRVRCTIAEARVLLECFRVLVDVASGAEDDEMLIAYAEAMGSVMDALDRVSRARN